MKKLFSNDPLTGVREIFHYDPVTEQATIETQQDYAPLAELNKAKFNSVDSLSRWGDGKLVASIPMSIYNRLRKEGVTQDQKAFKRWLNDPDNKVFRVRPGKV